ncbi:MAG: hypothetical protein ACKV2T_24075 [Kofleriaceae bacterium]
MKSKKVHSWKFVADTRTPVYTTLAAELDALARGKKPISFFATDARGLAGDLREIEPLAKKRGLVVTVAKRSNQEAGPLRSVTGERRNATDIFVHRVGGEALIAPLQDVLSRSPWSFEHEASLGELLGYSPKVRKAWLAAERHARPAFGVMTMYADIVAGYPFPLTWWAEPGFVPAPDAYKLMNRSVPGLQLWRAGVDVAYVQHLDARGVVELAGAGKKVNSTFDKAMRTELEMLGPKGWHIPPRCKTRRRR